VIVKKQIEYLVVITTGTFLPKNIKFLRTNFCDENPFKAREDAIKFAKTEANKNAKTEQVIKSQSTDGELQKNKNLQAFSVDVFFMNGKESHTIYSQVPVDLLFGLKHEAIHYIENNLIDVDKLVSIYQSRNEISKDLACSAFVLAKEELNNWPNTDYVEVSVLPNNLNLIISNLY